MYSRTFKIITVKKINALKMWQKNSTISIEQIKQFFGKII